MVGRAAAEFEVARLVGGPLARVNAACAAAAAVLTKHPTDRGHQLRQRIRHELGQRFDHDGELTDAANEWELRPLTNRPRADPPASGPQWPWWVRASSAERPRRSWPKLAPRWY